MKYEILKFLRKEPVIIFQVTKKKQDMKIQNLKS